MIKFINFAARWLWAAFAGRLLAARFLPNIHPPAGRVKFGSLRRLEPISYHFGFDRGLPIDRYYIEDFLAHNKNDIQGHVLEVGDNTYTRKFGGNGVSVSDVLHVKIGNPKATIVADLTCAGQVPSDTFDCIILTQTLHFIYDVKAAIQTLYRILKPGGVLLATFPGLSHYGQGEWSHSWYWGFTTHSAHQLFTEAFPPQNVFISSHGNVLAATAFLYGLAVKDLRQNELDHYDPHYEVLITARAVKPVDEPQ